MIQLSDDKGVICTNWILKLNKDSRKRVIKSGEEKTYLSYFTSFPQELYDFFDIEENKLYLVKEDNLEEKVIITDKEPSLPVNYISVKLIIRRKQYSKENRIPTTSFTLSKKMFNHLENSNKVWIHLQPNSIDKYRNKMGLITIKVL